MTETALTKKQFETLSEFRYLLRCFLRFSEDVTQRHGITHLQYQMLLHLRGFRGREWATVGELAERLQSHHHGVVSLVTRCEKQGWVERREGRQDRREVEIHLTPKGNELVALLAEQHRGEVARLRSLFLYADGEGQQFTSEPVENLNP